MCLPGTPFGNAGRNILRGDTYASVDLALARRIPLGGRVGLWVEAQAFNLFNQVNYDLPELYVDEPATFGRFLGRRRRDRSNWPFGSASEVRDLSLDDAKSVGEAAHADRGVGARLQTADAPALARPPALVAVGS